MSTFLFNTAIAAGLAMDAFAVSLGIGTTRKTRNSRSIFRLSFHMGLFQGLMAFLGWLAGSRIDHLISQVDHWIALVLLVYVGMNMIRSGLNPEIVSYCQDPSRGKTLIVLCFACSIDAMAVGLSMAMVGSGILSASLVIAAVTLGFSLFGLLFGDKMGEKFGKRMEVMGGVLLNGIGLRILLTHLF